MLFFFLSNCAGISGIDEREGGPELITEFESYRLGSDRRFIYTCVTPTPRGRDGPSWGCWTPVGCAMGQLLAFGEAGYFFVDPGGGGVVGWWVFERVGVR